jgi:diguanylate cyclase (GGDEF)-like protein
MLHDSSLLYDPLTGLVGPTLLQDRLYMATARARRHSCSTALILMSVDGYAGLVEERGSETGDTLIRDVAQRISSSLRATDTVSRIEGCTFGVILEDVLITENTLVVVDKIIKLFDEPFLIAAKNRMHTASIGLATFPSNGDDNETLVSRAYACLREAAGRSGNSFEVAPFGEKKNARRAV